MTTTVKVTILELAMLAGIVLSAFLVPRSFPLKTFVEIAVGVLISGNVLLFQALKRSRSVTKYQFGQRAYLSMALVVLYWFLVALFR